jgi:hypothetical protein
MKETLKKVEDRIFKNGWVTFGAIVLTYILTCIAPVGGIIVMAAYGIGGVAYFNKIKSV